MGIVGALMLTIINVLMMRVNVRRLARMTARKECVSQGAQTVQPSVVSRSVGTDPLELRSVAIQTSDAADCVAPSEMGTASHGTQTELLPEVVSRGIQTADEITPVSNLSFPLLFILTFHFWPFHSNLS